MFLIDYSITPTALGVALEMPGFEPLWVPARLASDAISTGRRAAE
jgi:hypothetical protein